MGGGQVPEPRTKTFPEPDYIEVDFRFDEQSAEVEKMKSVLGKGMTVVLTQTQGFDSIGRAKTEVFVHFMAIDGKEYLRTMREENGELIGETTGEVIMRLGAKSGEAERIMETLAAGGDMYLIPDDGPGEDGVYGKYTLCYPSL